MQAGASSRNAAVTGVRVASRSREDRTARLQVEVQNGSDVGRALVVEVHAADRVHRTRVEVGRWERRLGA